MSGARLTRNNRNEFEYPKAKRRKTSIDCELTGTIDGSTVKLENNDITGLHVFDPFLSNDFDRVNSSKSPETLMENDIVIKAEILDSISFENENEGIDSIESKDNKCEMSEKMIKPKCKMTSPMKAKRNESIKDGDVLIEEENIMEELEDIEENEQISDYDREVSIVNTALLKVKFRIVSF